MTQQTNGTPDIKYSEEAFRDMYEVLKEVWAYLAPKCHDTEIKLVCDKIGEVLAGVEGDK